MIDYTGSCGAQGCEHWAHGDIRGSVVATADETGAKRDIYTYTTYGAPAEPGGVPFRYTGQKYDEDVGLYHYKARFFDAETGRFVSPDPIRYGDGCVHIGGIGVCSSPRRTRRYLARHNCNNRMTMIICLLIQNF